MTVETDKKPKESKGDDLEQKSPGGIELGTFYNNVVCTVLQQETRDQEKESTTTLVALLVCT